MLWSIVQVCNNYANGGINVIIAMIMKYKEDRNDTKQIYDVVFYVLFAVAVGAFILLALWIWELWGKFDDEEEI